jgi:cyclase
MLQTRVIPVLLLRGKGLVKTIKFDKAKYIGDPINAVKIFNEKEVDELLVLDIDASKENRKPNFELIQNIASECFMPLGYGGGIRELDDIKKLFQLGVEKIVLNVKALENLKIIEDSSKIFGEQSIVASIDIVKNFIGKYNIYNHAKKKTEKIDLVEYLNQIQKAGVGEIFINSVDLDGTMKGYDLNLLKLVNKNCKVPFVICGGAGKIADFLDAKEFGASAAAGSLFVYHGPHKAVLINYPSQQELKKLFK